MNHGHTVESLCAFTERVKQAFLDKRIAAPVHLNSTTQAGPLLDIFKEVRPEDWVFSTWRSGFHALLKGIPTEEVFGRILEGRSMYLSSREHRLYCSSIVGGILPIALGVAAGIKRIVASCQMCNGTGRVYRNVGDNMDWTCTACRWLKPPKVWVFVGDMCYRTGLFHEFDQYATGHNLPINVVIEDNGLSTNAETQATWGGRQIPRKIYSEYRYKRTEAHVGPGTHVTF